MTVENEYGLNLDKVQLNLALILRGSIPDLKRIVNKLEKENGIFVVYKKASCGKFNVMYACKEE